MGAKVKAKLKENLYFFYLIKKLDTNVLSFFFFFFFFSKIHSLQMNLNSKKHFSAHEDLG